MNNQFISKLYFTRVVSGGVYVPVLELVTVSAIAVLAITLPEVPVMVTVEVPAVAELLAVSVSTLLPPVGFALNAAVTPAGRPEPVRVTLPVNPFTSVTVMVSAPLPLWAIESAGAEGASVKPGVPPPVTVIVNVSVLGQPAVLV